MPSPAMPKGGQRRFADRAATPTGIGRWALRTSWPKPRSCLAADDDFMKACRRGTYDDLPKGMGGEGPGVRRGGSNIKKTRILRRQRMAMSAGRQPAERSRGQPCPPPRDLPE
jgi:hypothetical protein